MTLTIVLEDLLKLISGQVVQITPSVAIKYDAATQEITITAKV